MISVYESNALFVVVLVIASTCVFMCGAVRLVKDPKTLRPKGFGFVRFESELDAQNALRTLNGRIVDGRLIFVEVAQTTRS